MTYDSIRLPEEIPGQPSYTLRQEVPALQLLATQNGHARWGPMTRLPQGAELSELGPGFDAQTVLVRYEGQFYIVFETDLAAAQKSSRSHGRAAHSA